MSDDTGTRAIKGVKHFGIASLAIKAFTILANIYLFRTLDQEIFGLYALAVFLTDFFTKFSGLGMSQAFIFFKGNEKHTYNATFSLTIITDVVISVLIFFTAPYYAGFVNNPEIVNYVRVLAVVPLIHIFQQPGVGLTKELRFATLSYIQIAKTVFYLGLLVSLAFFGFGIWALLLAFIFETMFAAVLVNVFSNFKIVKPKFDRVWMKKMLKYSFPLVVGTVVGMLSMQIQNVILGKLGSALLVGYYYFGGRLTLIPMPLLDIVKNLTFPVLSKVRDEKERQARYFLKMIKYSSLALVPAYFGLAIIAKPLIEIAYTTKWMPALLISQIMLIQMAFSPLSMIATEMYSSIGRTDVARNFSIYGFFFVLILGSIATYYYSILGLVIVGFIRIMISVFLHTWLAKKYMKINVIKPMVNPFLASLVMMLCMHFLLSLIDNIYFLVLSILAGALIYGLVLFLLEGKKLYGEIISMIKRAI